MRRTILITLVLIGGTLPVRGAEPSAKFTREQEDFFEKSVRPLLAKRCFECHGPDLQEAGVRLDSREAILKGVDGHAMAVPGKADKSHLMAVTRYDGDVQMPPDGKLPSDELAVLNRWIEMGLPWPVEISDAAAPKAADDMAGRLAQHRAEHWSLQSIRRPALPQTKLDDWCASPVDRFIAAELEVHGLKPSPAADRRTLLRRATFDLLGIPPTAEEIAAFESDPSPDAFAKVVDRLLASPLYGQRWARHWLDVARYADTAGYTGFMREARFPYAYTYRDYVVRSLNEDLPYNRFVLEQLAADQLPDREPEDARPLAAMGFLTVGNHFHGNAHNMYDDRIDVVTRGLLGLSVACARCHDHKYEAIPTADYYSLYGVFASSVEPPDLPIIGTPADTPGYRAYVAELARLEAKVDAFRIQATRELEASLRSHAADYLAETLKGEHADDGTIRVDELKPKVLDRWQRLLNSSQEAHQAIFGLWHEFAALPAADFAEQAKAVLAKAEAPAVNRLVRAAFAAKPPSSMQDVVKVYGDLFARIDRRWVAATEIDVDDPLADELGIPTKLADADAEALRQVLYGPKSPSVVPEADFRALIDRKNRDEFNKLYDEAAKLKANSPHAPPRPMMLVDAASPMNPHVFVRGNPDRKGPEVPRRFLSVVAGEQRKPFEHGSGRLELAQAIVDPANPLTARVFVNRVWMHHMGRGLVSTPSDFGTRGERPTHPALLDYLAATFVEEGWSIKQLHRQIMLSRVYQQASDELPAGVAVDSENRWLWRMNRRRLEWEALRDALLAVAGSLDTTVDGNSVDLWTAPYTARRSLYGFLDRRDMPGVLGAFDFPHPDSSAGERTRTTVPQQALFLMNSPFVLEQARQAAANAELAAVPSSADKVTALYRTILARTPDKDELQAALKLVETLPVRPAPTPLEEGDEAPWLATALTPWELLAQVLMLSNEFIFID